MFCRIYIGINTDIKTLLLSISNLLGMELIKSTYLEKNGYSVDITSKDEYDEKRINAFPDGFLYFPLSIEMEIEDHISHERAAQEVSKILKFLWKNGYPAIASCDFEDLLPENGGYKSRNVPWPDNT